MIDTAYIEHLRISPLRPKGPLPRISSRLIELVRHHGAIEPVVVRPVEEGRYEILSNVETWMAAQQVRLESVPIYIRCDLGDQEAREILEASFGGYETDPIEEAESLAECIDESANGSRHRAVAKLAYQTGHSRTYISHSLRLLKLPTRLQAMVRDGQLRAGHARVLVGISNRAAQLNLANKVVSIGWSVRRLEREARGVREGVQLGTVEAAVNHPPKKDPSISRLERTLTDNLGCRTDIDAKRGSLTIRYHTLDVLDGVLHRLGVTGN